MCLVFIFIPKKCFLLDLSNTQISKYYYYYYFFFFLIKSMLDFLFLFFYFGEGWGFAMWTFFVSNRKYDNKVYH